MSKEAYHFAALGYGIEDYISMFDLTQAELEMSILDCHPGISLFTEEMTARHHHVVATDPLYARPISEIKTFVKGAQAALLEDVGNHGERYELTQLEVKQKLSHEEKGVKQFLDTLPQNIEIGRYHTDGLPNLTTFQKEHFDLALVHHFLFTESAQHDLEFHLHSLLELARVTNEIRVFPLLTRQGELSPYVGEVIARLQLGGLGAELRGVHFRFQKKGNAMLRVWNESCTIRSFK